MENEKKFLPIGTVVILKNGKRELMITGYCIIPSGQVYDKNGEVEATGKMYDYGACYYPEGMIRSDQMFAFDHEQIDRVCYKGYETDKQKEFSDILNKESTKFKEDLEKTVEESKKEQAEAAM